MCATVQQNFCCRRAPLGFPPAENPKPVRAAGNSSLGATGLRDTSGATDGWHVPPGGVVPPELARQQAHATKLQGAPAAASEGPNIASLCSPGAGDLETESPKYRTQEGERQVVDIRGVRAGMCPHAKRELRTLRSTYANFAGAA